MKKEIQTFLEMLGAHVSDHSPEIYSFVGQREIDVYFAFFEDKLFIDLQYNPLTERLYDGKTPSLKKFKKIISGSKLNYLLEHYLKRDEKILQ
ncbi:hypothetical protein AB670_02548 [Chryseobacterium sp. MOF25P]|uniref:hypothetical protein n=2 Tax=Chryseobacterium TaxID=59732 RepID=UPI000805D9D9|nr:hypothetical protein [Chryseobacterium sp.]MBO6183070.1 hypothetical protein [Chryseobacterium sp.]OBW41097.1 hypothetical protein AB670_02548 [Chryseobacterium sp. MOF25P]OBW45773.1 hypothetical protein AB671_02181 [Chryseobacterium sp. BGARF1]